MSPKKDEYMRGYADGFKDGSAVKTLEWKDGVAASSLGNYSLVHCPGCVYLQLNRSSIEKCSGEAEAKAAAQADFKARIRAALHPTQQPPHAGDGQ